MADRRKQASASDRPGGGLDPNYSGWLSHCHDLSSSRRHRGLEVENEASGLGQHPGWT